MKARGKIKPARANEATGAVKKTSSRHLEQKQQNTAFGEVQYGHTTGRHETGEENNLNPEAK